MRPWHENPEAAALLKELGANPPAKRVARYAFGETAEVYSGNEKEGGNRAVWKLRKLYRLHGEALGSDNGPNFVRWAQDSVDAAIDRAIEAHAERLAA